MAGRDANNVRNKPSRKEEDAIAISITILRRRCHWLMRASWVRGEYGNLNLDVRKHPSRKVTVQRQSPER